MRVSASRSRAPAGATRDPKMHGHHRAVAGTRRDGVIAIHAEGPSRADRGEGTRCDEALSVHAVWRTINPTRRNLLSGEDEVACPAKRGKRAPGPRGPPAELDAPGATQMPGCCKHQSSSHPAGGRAARFGHDRSCRPGQRRHRSWAPPRELPGAAARRLTRQCWCRPRRDCLPACSCPTLSYRSRAPVGPGRCDAQRARLWRHAGRGR